MGEEEEEKKKNQDKKKEAALPAAVSTGSHLPVSQFKAARSFPSAFVPALCRGGTWMLLQNLRDGWCMWPACQSFFFCEASRTGQDGAEELVRQSFIGRLRGVWTKGKIGKLRSGVGEWLWYRGWWEEVRS